MANAGQSDNEVIVAIDDPDKTQYHAANFDTSKFNYFNLQNQKNKTNKQWNKIRLMKYLSTVLWMVYLIGFFLFKKKKE